MAHLSTTVRGVLVALLLIALAIPLVVWSAIALSGPVVWISLALVAILVISLIVRSHLLDAARERAYDPAVGFGNVIRKMRAQEALADARRVQAREERSIHAGG